MKKFLVLFIGLFLIFSVVSAQEAWEKIPVEKSIVHLNYSEGEVFFRGKTHESIKEGDGIRTERGRAEVYLGGRNWIRLNYYTQVTFLTLQSTFAELHVTYGEIYIHTESTVEIKTPHKAFSLRGLYRIEVKGEKTKKYKKPLIQDNFDRWNSWRNKQVNRPVMPKRFSTFLGARGSWDYHPWRGWIWRARSWNRNYTSSNYWYYRFFYRYGNWHKDNQSWYWTPKSKTVIRKNQLRKK